MPFPKPNRQHLSNHPYRDDYQRILTNAFELARDIEIQFRGYMPFGIALSKSDDISFIGYQGGQLPKGLLEDIETRLFAMKSIIKACARCTRVDIKLESGHRLSALQVQLEHLNGIPLQAYQPIQSTDQWWVEKGNDRIFIKGKQN